MKFVKVTDRTPDDYKPDQLLNLRLVSPKGVKVPWVGTYNKKENTFYFEDISPIGKERFNEVEWLDESTPVEDGWVKVTDEKKPEKRIKVLIFSKWGTDFGHLDNDGIFKFADGNYDVVSDEDITHWMPMPKTPPTT